MTRLVNIHEAKTHFSKLVKRAHNGEEIIVAKAGKPYARLVPLEQREERHPGLATGCVTDAFFEPLPAGELDSWEK